MPDDLRALLAAIVADPADDTARLAYADCLQEHGNTVRADFIRLQIEAARLHPDSNARARLEEKAQALFSEHWIDWWGEVCEAVGFPLPTPKPRGPLGRLARRIGIVGLPGHPYHPGNWSQLGHFWVGRRYGGSWDEHLRGWSVASFRRGFPDSFSISLPDINLENPLLSRWSTASPIAELVVAAPYTEGWIDGPHLAGVKSLTLDDYDPVALLGLLNSPHLARLEELTLCVHVGLDDYNAMFAEEFAHAVMSPRIRQLRRLKVPVWTQRAAEIVAGAENLVGLEALVVELHPSYPELLYEYTDQTGAGR